MSPSVTLHSLTAPDGRTWVADPPLSFVPRPTNLGWEADLSEEAGLLAYAPSPDRLPAVLGGQLALHWDAVCTVESWWDMTPEDQERMDRLALRFLPKSRKRRPVAPRVVHITCRPGCLGGAGCRHSPERPYR